MSKDFFLKSLNYSMANEDTHLEREIVYNLQSKRVLSVCGSGSRAFPLISDFTEKLDIIDMSKMQLDFAKLRQETILKYEYNKFIEFWGYKRLDKNLRKKEYQDFLNKVSPELEDLFENEKWESPIYYGKWEKTYQSLNKLVQIAIGTKKIDRLKACKDLNEQVQVYNSFSFQLRWRLVLIIVGNRALFNSLLYKGKFVDKNIKQSYVQFYIQAFDKLFNRKMLKNSYFLQMSFLGKIEYLSGVPIEADEKTFQLIKKNIQHTNINYIEKNIIDYLRNSKKVYDLISISDVPSYFDDDMGRHFLEHIKPRLEIGGVVIVRYYLKVCEPNQSGYLDVSNKYQELVNAEGVQMYKVKVYQRT